MYSFRKSVFRDTDKTWKKLASLGLFVFCFSALPLFSVDSGVSTPPTSATSDFSIDDFLKELEADKKANGNGTPSSAAIKPSQTPPSAPAPVLSPSLSSANTSPLVIPNTQDKKAPAPLPAQETEPTLMPPLPPVQSAVKETSRAPVMDSTLSTIPGMDTNPVKEENTQEAYYTSPGIIAYKDGKWIGSDHLYNLPSTLSLNVEILKPENAEIELSEMAIRDKIVSIFKKADLTVVDHVDPAKGPLPLYHMLVMIYPIDRGFVAYCDGRLFESVKLQRVVLDKTTELQAITWENQSLILAPEKEFVEQLNKTVDEISNQFVNRFQYYENIRLKNKK